MLLRWRVLLGGLCGTGAAVIWAVALAVYQPFMQPSGPDTDQVASNNTYWPRDIRQLAILLAFAAVVLIAGTRRRALLTAAGSAFAWLAADLWLDRIDVAGRGTAVGLALAGTAWFAATAALARRLSAGADRSATTGGPGDSRRPEVAGADRSEAADYLLAGTAAILAVLTTIVTTPWDEPVTKADQVRVENALTLLKCGLVAGFALCAIALIAHRLTRRRAVAVAGFAALAALATWPATSAYGPLGALGLFGMPVAAALAIAATRDAPPWRLALVAVTSAFALVALIPLSLLGIRVGSAMTAFAHNPAVNGADSDLPISLVALALGALLSVLSYAVTVTAPPRYLLRDLAS